MTRSRLEAERVGGRPGAGARGAGRAGRPGGSARRALAPAARSREAAAAARDARRSLDAAPDRRRRALAARGSDGRGDLASGARRAAHPGVGAPLRLDDPALAAGDRCGSGARSRAAARPRSGTKTERWSGFSTEVEVFEWDKPKYALRVYRTERLDHPGGRLISGDRAARLVGGSLRALPQAVNPEYGEYMLSPRIVRARIRERKWQRALAFQTRNPLHRAHEYALVAGAERLTREGWFTGVVLNPLVGELKGDDVPALTRMRCYRVLHDRGLLGEGRQGRGALAGARLRPDGGLRADRPRHPDVLRRAVGSGDARDLPAEPRLQRPRDRAQARRRAVRGRQADLGRLRRAGDLRRARGRAAPARRARSASPRSTSRSGASGLTEDHPDEKPVVVSGTRVREQLQKGERPDPRIMRPEIADVLIEAYRSCRA